MSAEKGQILVQSPPNAQGLSGPVDGYTWGSAVSTHPPDSTERRATAILAQVTRNGTDKTSRGFLSTADKLQDLSTVRDRTDAQSQKCFCGNVARVQQLTHDLEHINWVHEKLLVGLHQQIDQLKTKNRDLTFQLLMSPMAATVQEHLPFSPESDDNNSVKTDNSLSGASTLPKSLTSNSSDAFEVVTTPEETLRAPVSKIRPPDMSLSKLFEADENPGHNTAEKANSYKQSQSDKDAGDEDKNVSEVTPNTEERTNMESKKALEFDSVDEIQKQAEMLHIDKRLINTPPPSQKDGSSAMILWRAQRGRAGHGDPRQVRSLDFELLEQEIIQVNAKLKEEQEKTSQLSALVEQLKKELNEQMVKLVSDTHAVPLGAAASWPPAALPATFAPQAGSLTRKHASYGTAPSALRSAVREELMPLPATSEGFREFNEMYKPQYPNDSYQRIGKATTVELPPIHLQKTIRDRPLDQTWTVASTSSIVLPAIPMKSPQRRYSEMELYEKTKYRRDGRAFFDRTTRRPSPHVRNSPTRFHDNMARSTPYQSSNFKQVDRMTMSPKKYSPPARRPTIDEDLLPERSNLLAQSVTSQSSSNTQTLQTKSTYSSSRVGKSGSPTAKRKPGAVNLKSRNDSSSPTFRARSTSRRRSGKLISSDSDRQPSSHFLAVRTNNKHTKLPPAKDQPLNKESKSPLPKRNKGHITFEEQPVAGSSKIGEKNVNSALSMSRRRIGLETNAENAVLDDSGPETSGVSLSKGKNKDKRRNHRKNKGMKNKKDQNAKMIS